MTTADGAVSGFGPNNTQQINEDCVVRNAWPPGEYASGTVTYASQSCSCVAETGPRSFYIDLQLN